MDSEAMDAIAGSGLWNDFKNAVSNLANKACRYLKAN